MVDVTTSAVSSTHAFCESTEKRPYNGALTESQEGVEESMDLLAVFSSAKGLIDE